HHHHVQLQAIAVNLDHLLEDGDLVLGRGPRRLLDGLFEHLDERVPAFGLLVQIGERAARRVRLRRFGDDLLPGVDALVDRLLRGVVRRVRFGLQLGRKIVRNAVATRSALLLLTVALALALLGLVIHCAPPQFGSVRSVLPATAAATAVLSPRNRRENWWIFVARRGAAKNRKRTEITR